MPRERIALVRIAQESNCFSPLRTRLEDFERCHYVEGKALLIGSSPSGTEAEGYLKHAELTGALDALRELGAEAVPIFSAWAIPGGPVEQSAFETLRGRLEEGLRAAGPLDGVVLVLHGAMGVEGVPDPDTQLIRAAKRATGGLPVAVTHDLHANLTRERVDEADILVGYRTNPHRDQRRTGYIAAKNLIATIRGERRPTTAWRSLPILLGGGATVDFLPPVRSIFRRLTALHRDARVMNASVMFCHPWNDEPRLGWSTHVTTDGDRALAEDLADELAERCWAVRHEQPPAFYSPAAAIERARTSSLARKLGIVVFSDASDVVSAGAPGDGTGLLSALLDGASDMVSYVPLRDPKVANDLFAKAEGANVRALVGGKLDPRASHPIEVEGKLTKKIVHPSLGKMIALDLGMVKLVVTEGHAMAVKPRFYSDLGLNPWKADIAVVKNFFPFRIYFALLARKVLYVRTEGATDLDAAFKTQFDGPMWPRDSIHEWRSTDARRRLAA
ncbi:MAG: hypothetical protein HOW73_26235 [Polyangiaceae bacterium]|nr:hypothetical protein [Polyangiaceae bacterium]